MKFAAISALLFLSFLVVYGFSAPSADIKPGSPEAKKKYEGKLEMCKDSSKPERCKWLARSLVYYDCMEGEDPCAFEAGKNGCMKETLDCIKSVIGSA